MLILILLSILTFSFAQTPKSCQRYIEEFCSENKTIPCLLKNEKKLSEECKQELQRAGQAAKATGVRGGTGLASFGGVIGNFGLVPSGKTVVNYTGMVAPDSSGFQQHKGSISTPIWQNEKESFSLSLGGGTLYHDQKFLLGDKKILVPQTLQRVELGGSYSRRLEGHRIFGVRGGFGSASDRPFYGTRDLMFNMNAYYGRPTEKNRYWFWTVFVSNNNPLLNYIPIPGFIYLYKSGNFTGMFGLPFASVQWTPVDPIILSASFFVSTLNLEAAYGTRDKFQPYLGFNLGQQSFLRHDREDDDDRLFLEEKKLFAGLRSPLTKDISSDVQVGQSFDRTFFEGRNFRDRESGEAHLDASWYLSLNLIITY